MKLQKKLGRFYIPSMQQITIFLVSAYLSYLLVLSVTLVTFHMKTQLNKDLKLKHETQWRLLLLFFCQ